MDPLELERVERSGRVADKHDAVRIRPRHRPPTAFWNRLRAVADHRSAVDELSNARVHLESLELGVRLELRILIVEADDEADIPDVVLHRIDEAAPEGRVVERSAERVDDLPSGRRARGHLPQLFDADRVDLRVFAGGDREAPLELLGKRAARSFAEHRDLRDEIRAGLVVRLRFAFFVESLVADAHAGDAVAIPQQLLTRKLRENLDAKTFGDGRHPFDELVETRDVLAAIVHRRRDDRGRYVAAFAREPQR